MSEQGATKTMGPQARSGEINEPTRPKMKTQGWPRRASTGIREGVGNALSVQIDVFRVVSEAYFFVFPCVSSVVLSLNFDRISCFLVALRIFLAVQVMFQHCFSKFQKNLKMSFV